MAGYEVVDGSHGSAVRRLMAKSVGRPYLSFPSLEAAQAAPAGAVILEGDYGGQIYATCPAKLVQCSEQRLRRLARQLDSFLWRRNGTSAAVVFEPLPPGAGVGGGMGGGFVCEGVWVHEEVRQVGWAPDVAGVLFGTRQALPPPHPEVPPDVRAGILRAYTERIDVFCSAFGFPSPKHVRTMPADEWRRRQQAVVPPPHDYRCWYGSTYRAVVLQAGYTLPRRRS